jgi:ADP-ribosyl-[dinitrogen reductase] hydrolase
MQIFANRNIGLAEVQVVIGDIANQPDVQAIVNAANAKLQMGSGVCGAICTAAGVEELTKACVQFSPIGVGEAVITSGFKLPNQYIIHCCGPKYKVSSDSARNLKSSYYNILTLAVKNKVTSLAIPAISTGAYGFPIEEATALCIETIKEFSPNFDTLKTIRFVVKDQETAAIYARLLLENLTPSSKAVKVEFEASFTPAQFLHIRKGFTGDMDEKWFFYFDDPWLYIFRGSRGFVHCAWYLRFQKIEDKYAVVESWVEDGIHGRGFEGDDTKWLYSLIYDYYLDENTYTDKYEYTHFKGSQSSSYSVLPSGRIKLDIDSAPLSVDELSKLGFQLIEIADQLKATHLKSKIINLSERFRGALLGLACGDAVGTTVEFRQRGTFPLVTDMVGGGPFKLKAGEWTDDTSMALCLAESLVKCKGFDAADQMHRYVMWLDEGYWSSNGSCFDIGGTTHDALNKFKRTGESFSGSVHAKSAGNGCIMRLAPVPMYFYPDRDAIIAMSGESSRTTHGAEECVEASQLFGAMLYMTLDGAIKDTILLGHGMTGFASAGIQSIANGEYRTKSESDIHGTGYVVQSLEAALWCFYHTSSFQEAILKAANLGQDADTTAAICGQIAGAFYGESGIHVGWRKKLAKHDEICVLADQLH